MLQKEEQVSFSIRGGHINVFTLFTLNNSRPYIAGLLKRFFFFIFPMS